MRVCVFSERIKPPFDEGIKNYAVQLIRELGRQHQVLALTAFGQGVPSLGIRNVPANRLLFSPWLARRIGSFRPEVVLYLPTASATPFSFLRSRMLWWYARGAPVVLIALQVRHYGKVARRVMRLWRPELVLVQSPRMRAALAALGCRLGWAPAGVDLQRFKPVAKEQRLALRERYLLSKEAYVVLHVGHLNRGRNVQALAAIQRELACQAVVAGSTSTPQDEMLVAELEQAGVRVLRGFLPNIAELYQLADCYLFPVQEECRAIDLPLSVLEAMASDLPVVTTRFGGLLECFAQGEGIHYVDSLEEMVQAVAACRDRFPAGTRALAQRFAWPRVMEQILEQVQEVMETAKRGQGA